jgi:peptide/nickel transport system permease protein
VSARVGFIKRILRSRGIRKLLRDRMAVVALAVISAYLAAAAAVGIFGLITQDEAYERVGPDQLVGFFEEPTIEQRMHYLEFYVEQVENALDRREPDKALAAIDLCGLTVASTDVDVMGEQLDALYETFEELYEIQEDEEFDSDPANFDRLTQLEADVAAMYLDPEGSALMFRAAALKLGTDRQGRSILLRAIYSIKVAVQIGLVAAFVSVVIGTILGGAAAFFGGWVDHAIVWLYSTFSAIPYIVLLMVLAAMFLGSTFEGTLVPVYAAFCMTFWIGPCRVIRGEVMKLRELEYVQAATAVGFGRMRILLKHIIPNTTHLMFINFSLLFIGAIKAEVILSFLGLGVKNEPSWGVMINQSRQEVISGFMWQIGAATFFMFILVLAFNVLSDALQDAFDPKHV